MACEAASLRSVAREVGMTPMGLRAFIRGGKPQERTLRKLNVWYTQRIANRTPEGEDAARAALAVLGGLYPLEDRVRVEVRVLDVMEDEFRQCGITPPPWLPALRAELRGSEE
jgi:hypothetical protein